MDSVCASVSADLSGDLGGRCGGGMLQLGMGPLAAGSCAPY